jgi:hypothetical protein
MRREQNLPQRREERQVLSSCKEHLSVFCAFVAISSRRFFTSRRVQIPAEKDCVFSATENGGRWEDSSSMTKKQRLDCLR